MFFRYRAKNLQGGEVTGEIEAQDKFEAASLLAEKKLVVLDVAVAGGRPHSFIRIWLVSFLRRVSLTEKMIFTRNLSVMVGAGLPLTKALDALSRQSHNAYFKEVLVSVSVGVSQGQQFSVSLSKFPGVFPVLFRAMVAAGEKAGNLEEVLQILAQQLQRDYVLRKQVKGALMYPAVIITAMMAVGILLMVYVVPGLVSLLKELNVELPLSTRLIIFISELFTKRAWMLLAVVIFIIGGVGYARRRPGGQKFFNKILLRIPVIRTLVKKFYTARIAQSLSSLLSSGVSLLESLDIVTDIVGNVYYRETLQLAKERIKGGGKISDIFLERTDLYPETVGEIISVGEETGKLSEILDKLASFYESEVTAATRDLSTIIEPILMIFVGIGVGLFALSVIQPMYSVVNAL